MVKPCSAIQTSLNIFERYLLPLSQTKLTIRFGLVCCRQYRSAPASKVPVEEPPRIPSLRKSSRAVAKLSESSISKASVTNDMSALSEQNPPQFLPPPSYQTRPAFPSSPIRKGSSRSDRPAPFPLRGAASPG